MNGMKGEKMNEPDIVLLHTIPAINSNKRGDLGRLGKHRILSVASLPLMSRTLLLKIEFDFAAIFIENPSENENVFQRHVKITSASVCLELIGFCHRSRGILNFLHKHLSESKTSARLEDFQS